MEFFCFDGCLSLKEIFIPDNVKTIFHFGICPSLETVNINNAVFDYDNENPFPSCSSLKNIIVSDRNPNHVCIDGVLYTKQVKDSSWQVQLRKEWNQQVLMIQISLHLAPQDGILRQEASISTDRIHGQIKQMHILLLNSTEPKHI